MKQTKSNFSYSKNMRISRENIIFFIYRFELLNKQIETNVAFEQYDFSKSELEKINSIVKRYSFLKDITIQNLKDGWPWERMLPLERAILIFGAFEMLFTDKKIVINEMIEITKEYTIGDRYKYINSILDKIGKSYDEKIKADKTDTEKSE